jgi:hypothetical protein
MPPLDWVAGDRFGLQIPAHGSALRMGGEEFLTQAFQAAGALAADNRVARITRLQPCPGGSTGSKLLLSVVFERPEPGLHGDLFVKFSRDFDDAIRDRARNQLESEVELALLSRTRGFPIAVPRCYFADYERESGTGLLITQRVSFGRDGIEPAYEKCLDYELPQPLEHYKALLRAVARLAGTHRAGGLDDGVSRRFPFDAAAAMAADRIRYSEQQLLNRVARYADFAAAHPGLLPANIRTPEFIAQLAEDVPRFLQHEPLIKALLYGEADFIALCHWNANVDNAWFWRNRSGGLECGLMDWGRVGQMSVALAIFGSLSAAETDLWDRHLDELLTLFATAVKACGGPDLDVATLRRHVLLFAATMGLAWLMDAPALIRAQLPDLAGIESRFDPRFRANETARVQLHMLTTVLNLWQTHRFGRILDDVLAEAVSLPARS